MILTNVSCGYVQIAGNKVTFARVYAQKKSQGYLLLRRKSHKNLVINIDLSEIGYNRKIVNAISNGTFVYDLWK